MAKRSSAAYWLRRARLLAFAVNVAWFWQRLLPALVVLNLVLAAWLLIIRQRGGDTGSATLPYVVGLVACVLFALIKVRGRLYSLKDALLRIETALGLHNRLSCAAAGVTEWPEAEAYRGKVLHLRPQAALLPLLYSAVFILIALWMPVRAAQSNTLAGEAVEPAAWSQVADWAELLREEQVIAPQSLDALEERLAQLRERPQEDWYKQGSLEAGEALRDETLLAMQELARQLQATGTLLDNIPLQEPGRVMGGVFAEQLDEHWQKQLQQLQNGQLSIDPEMLAQLQGLSLSQMNNLTEDQLQAMREQLQQGAQNVGGAAGLGELDLEAVSMQAQEAFSGEVARGPGAAPLVLNPQETTLQAGKKDGISNQEMRTAMLGETVGISSRPGNDGQETQFQSGIRSEGTASEGEGGNVVWQEAFAPQERAILEKYFK